MKTVAAFGNPLLDTIANIPDFNLLHKYNLEKDGQKEVDQKTMQSLSKDIEVYEKSISAGGCSQNTLRVLQWLSNKRLKTYIYGSVGDDTDAITLKQLLENDEVYTRYSVQRNLSTGTSISLVTQSNRSLVANVEAAENYSLNDLLASDYEEVILRCSYVYIEGFFLTKRKDVVKHVVNYCNKNRKLLIFNLSGQYLVEQETELVTFCIERADVIFGNKREYVAYCKLHNLPDIKSLAHHLIKHTEYKHGANKIVIVTNGAEDVYCYDNSDIEYKFIVPPVHESEIVDTTGAGDAFVAGFIAGLLAGKTLNQCSEIGCYAAHNIIKLPGCTLPDFKPNLGVLLE